jgi:hypothetical protein
MFVLHCNINGFEVSSSQASVKATVGERRASQIYWAVINSSKNKHKKESVALNDVCFVSIALATAFCYFVKIAHGTMHALIHSRSCVLGHSAKMSLWYKNHVELP